MTLKLRNSYAALAQWNEEKAKSGGNIASSSSPVDKQVVAGPKHGKGGGYPLHNG